MITTIKTAPTIYPVSLSEAKKQCEIIGPDHDDYLTSLIDVSTGRVEQYLHRRLITQTWYLYLEDWPSVDYITIPFGKLQSVTSVKYTDSDGVEATFSSADYIVDTDSEPARIVLGYDEVWPTATLYPAKPIKIEFICGYGTTSATVPAPIRHAIKLSISSLFETRETESFVPNYYNLKTFESLLTPYKLFGGVF